MDLECDIADFLGTETAISAFLHLCLLQTKQHHCRRRGVSCAILNGIQISQSTVRWYDSNDPKSLELALESDEKKRKSPDL